MHSKVYQLQSKDREAKGFIDASPNSFYECMQYSSLVTACLQ